MQIKDLFKLTEKWDVLNSLYKLRVDNDELYKYRPDIKENIKDRYNSLYDSIVNIKVKEQVESNKFLIVLKEKNNEEIFYTSFYVLLEEVKEKRDLINIEQFELYEDSENFSKYGLIFVEWDEILNMNICQKSLENYPKEEILAQILWEMTFFGNENEMNEEKNKLVESIIKIENEETKYYSVEEVFENIYNKFGIQRKTEDEKEILLKKERLLKEIKENKINQDAYIVSILN